MTSSKSSFAVALVVAAGMATVAAGAPAAGPVAVVRASFDAFNRGDQAAVAKTLAPQQSIVDNFAPHEWHGADAFQAWGNDYDKWSKSAGVTDGKLTIQSIVRSQVDGDSAYVVVACDFTYRLHGRRMLELGREAVSLRNGADGWKITGWGWAGDVPHAVSAKPKAPAAAPPKT